MHLLFCGYHEAHRRHIVVIDYFKLIMALITNKCPGFYPFPKCIFLCLQSAYLLYIPLTYYSCNCVLKIVTFGIHTGDLGGPHAATAIMQCSNFDNVIISTDEFIVLGTSLVGITIISFLNEDFP